MARIFKTIKFEAWAAEVSISDADLYEAIEEIENGLFEANLGSHLYKKRISISGKGKRGGARTILAFRKEDKAFFIYGYAKSKKSNLSEKELIAYKEAAKIFLDLNESELKELLLTKKIKEIKKS